MRVYPVTSNELWGLGATGLISTFFFSTGSAAIGFALDTAKDLALSSGADQKTVAYWSALETFTFWGGVALLVFGVAGLGLGGWYISGIINRTTFDEVD
jgi:hypothetical protein